MGLFFGMTPAADKRVGSGTSYNVREPVVYRLTIRNNSGETLDDVTIRRPFLHSNVDQREIDEAGIIGTLFLPRGDRFTFAINLGTKQRSKRFKTLQKLLIAPE